MKTDTVRMGGLWAALFFALAVPGATPSRANDAEAGKQKAGACTVCHGALGIAEIPDAPNLAGESSLYLSNQLKAFRGGKRRHHQMTLIAQGLSDEDISDLAAWFSAIKVTAEEPDL